MNNARTYILLCSGFLILSYWLGLLPEYTITSIIGKALPKIIDLMYAFPIFSTIIGATGTIIVTALLATGSNWLLGGDITAVVRWTMGGLLIMLTYDFVATFVTKLNDLNPIIATIFFSPMIVTGLMALFEWLEKR